MREKLVPIKKEDQGEDGCFPCWVGRGRIDVRAVVLLVQEDENGNMIDQEGLCGNHAEVWSPRDTKKKC